MGHIAVAVPAVTVKWLGTHDDRFDFIFMAADAVGLDDLLGPIARPDGSRDVPRGEDVDILGTLPSLFKVVDNFVFMG